MLNQGLSRSGDRDAASAAYLAAQREGGRGGRGPLRQEACRPGRARLNCPSVIERANQLFNHQRVGGKTGRSTRQRPPSQFHLIDNGLARAPWDRRCHTLYTSSDRSNAINKRSQDVGTKGQLTGAGRRAIESGTASTAPSEGKRPRNVGRLAPCNVPLTGFSRVREVRSRA